MFTWGVLWANVPLRWALCFCGVPLKGHSCMPSIYLQHAVSDLLCDPYCHLLPPKLLQSSLFPFLPGLMVAAGRHIRFRSPFSLLTRHSEVMPDFDGFRQAARRSSCLRDHTANAVKWLRYKSMPSASRIMSFTTIATTPSVFTNWDMSNTMSYLDVDPRAEVRLICLRRFRQGEGYTPWQVANSPGILMSELQYPRRAPREVLEMGPQVDEVVNCLTNFINDGQFQAKIDSRTAADNVIQWTEW